MNPEHRHPKPARNPPGLWAVSAAAAIAVCLLLHGPGVSAQEAMLPLVAQGYELPAGIQLYRPRGTGQTTGHIATLTIENKTEQPFEMPATLFYIPSDGRYQGYVGWPAPGQVVPPGASQEVPVEGYCSSVRLPPVPAGEALPPPEDWIVSTGELGPIQIPEVDEPEPPGLALMPGTDTPLPRAVSLDDEPLVAVPLLLEAFFEIEQTTADLQASGALVTPFSSNRERERQAVVQQTFWIFTAELENEQPYTQEEFTERLQAQYEQSTGVAIAEAPEEDRQQLEQGAGDFWNAFQLVGAEAKVINVSPGARAASGLGAAAGQSPAGDKPSTTAGAPAGRPAAPAAPPACSVAEDITHSPPKVEVRIGEKYGDEEERTNIAEGIRSSVESGEIAYFTATPPSTAFSLWRVDIIGGISSGYARNYPQGNDEEGVWSTEPLTTSADGNGVHSLTFTHGPECRAVVAGSAGLWLRASSESFDPLEGGNDFPGAAGAVNELIELHLGESRPSDFGDGPAAGADTIGDPSGDAQAAGSGSATLVVGDDRDSGTAANRVVYRRQNEADKTVIGGGETVASIKVSDNKPDSLTSRIDASVTMEARAAGNALARAYLESIYGTILVGVCECPNAPPLHKVITNNSQFLRTAAAESVLERANREMQTAADLIGHAIEVGNQETDGESLQERAEAELEKWVRKVVGDHFEPEAETPSN